jgi:hypothetical protein
VYGETLIADDQHIGAAVAVDVGEEQALRTADRDDALGCGEAAVAAAVQDAQLVGALVGDHQIGVAIAVQVTDREVASESRRRELVALPAAGARR